MGKKIKDLALVSETGGDYKIPISDLTSNAAQAVSLEQITTHVGTKLGVSDMKSNLASLDAAINPQDAQTVTLGADTGTWDTLDWTSEDLKFNIARSSNGEWKYLSSNVFKGFCARNTTLTFNSVSVCSKITLTVTPVVDGDTCKVTVNGETITATSATAKTITVGAKTLTINVDDHYTGLAFTVIYNDDYLSEEIARAKVVEQSIKKEVETNTGDITYLAQKVDKAAMCETPSEEVANLDISDESGNIIAELRNGHIKTKYFDSNILNLGTKKVHMSFDDGEYSIKSLFSGNYTRVWDNPFFAMLYRLHVTYNATFTINLYIDSFDVITDAYACQLGAAASWLKWTSHGAKSENYATRTEGAADWNNMVSAIVTLTGTPNAIDRHTRLHNFAGAEEQLVAMSNCKFGAICFSTADDSRLSYNLDSNEAAYVWNNNEYYDSKNNLHFVRSYTRLDGKTMSYSVKTNILSYINARDFSEFFIHEFNLINSSYELVTTGCTFLEDFFELMYNNNFKCTFYNV